MFSLNRLEFPCPTCDAEISQFCMSVQGNPMARFVHPERGKQEFSLDGFLKLRQWLVDYGDIFRLPDD